MTGRRSLRHLVGLCCLLLGLNGPAMAATPQRIVSLAPAVTEILFGLGLGDRVVGVTSVCDRPDAARGKPQVGGMANPSLEAILALHPELVVLTTDGNPKAVADQLHRLGIATDVFTARRLEEIPRGIRELGTRLDAGGAAELMARTLERNLNRYSRSATGERRKALFVIWPEPLIAAGPGTLIDDALRLVGFDNIAGDAAVAYPRFSVEEALRRAPDVIFLGQGHGDMAPLARRLMTRLAPLGKAGKGAVVAVGDALYRPGPRLPEGVAELAQDRAAAPESRVP